MAVLALYAVGSAIGGAIGGTFLGVSAAAWGGAIATAVGSSLLAPTQTSQGPRLADLKAAAVTAGSVIPYVEGHPRLGGVIAWASIKRELKNTTSSGGKGGGGSEQTTFTYEQDLMYVISENTDAAGVMLRRVWANGELIWTRAEDGVQASVENESELWTRITCYDGNSAQLADPTYEAAVGIGNAPAYRTRVSIFIESIKLGTSGEPPNLTFEIVMGGSSQPFNAPVFDAPMTADVQDTVATFASASVTHSVGITVSPSPLNAVFAGVVGTGSPRVVYTGGKLAPGSPPVLTYLLEFSDVVYTASTDYQFIFSLSNGPTEVDFGFATSGGVLRLAHRFVSGGGVSVTDGVWANTGTSVMRLTINDPVADNVRIYVDDELIAEGSVAPSFSSMTLSGFGTIAGSPFDAAPGGVTSWTCHRLRMWYGVPSTADVVALVEPTLQQVVERQCTRGELSLSYVDASALATRNVRSMAITQITSPRGVIEMLMQAYSFTCVESDKIYFRWRGADPVATVTFDELVANGNDPLPINKANDLELPVQIFVKYSNVFDDYQDGNESSDRLVSSSTNTLSVEFPLGFSPIEAKRIADALVTDAASSLFTFGPFGLTRDYAALEPSDVIVLQAQDGTPFRVRLTRQTEAAGVLTFEAVSDQASAVSSVATTTTSGYGSSTAVKLPVDTDLVLLDMPILADADDNAGFYAAVKPDTDASSFPGAVLFKSTDNVTFDTVGSSTQAAIFGTAATVLGDGPVGVFDEAASVTVNVGFGTLSSITRDALLNGIANLMLVGSEVIQFRTATLVSAGIYTLTGLLRGRRGTEWATATHAADEAVVLLDAAVKRVPLSNADLGLARWWKAVTMGRTGDTATAEFFTDNGVGLKPFAPVDLRVARDASNNIAITLQRRSRLSTRLIGPLGISCPLGEDSERYAVDVYATSGYSTIKRTLTASAPSLAYLAADQVTDFGSAQSAIYVKAYQLSAAVGRGNALTAHG
jgi:hypothetical protein